MNNSNRKTAIVTGASRGIGEAIALNLAHQGNQVVINYQSNQGYADAVVNEITSRGGIALAIKADISNPAETKQLFEEAIDAFGPIDVLVSNAAIQVHKLFNQHSEEDLDNIINVNAKGVFRLLQEASNHLSDNGHIVAISTSLTSMMVPGYAAYTGAKAAVEQYVRSLAKELARRGININAIAPGPVDTDLLRNTESADGLQFLANLSGFGRLGTPEDIADVVGFFCSDASRWISGQVIRANGALI